MAHLSEDGDSLIGRWLHRVAAGRLLIGRLGFGGVVVAHLGGSSWWLIGFLLAVTSTLCSGSTLHTLFSFHSHIIIIIILIICVASSPLLYRFHTVGQQLITMFLQSRTPQPGGGSYNHWGVLIVGCAISAGLGFLAGNTHSQEGWKNLKHAITERNLFLNGIVDPFEPAAEAPYEPAFDPEKNFTTPAAQFGVEFEKNLFPVRLVILCICCTILIHTDTPIHHLCVNVNDRNLK